MANTPRLNKLQELTNLMLKIIKNQTRKHQSDRKWH